MQEQQQWRQHLLKLQFDVLKQMLMFHDLYAVLQTNNYYSC